MAEEGIVVPSGQPVMGAGPGGKMYFLPASFNYQSVVTSGTVALSGGGGGAKGDYLDGVLVIPANSNVSAISVKDGGGSAISIFTGGSASVADLKPFYIPVKARSTSGGWSITTSGNAAALVSGAFT